MSPKKMKKTTRPFRPPHHSKDGARGRRDAKRLGLVATKKNEMVSRLTMHQKHLRLTVVRRVI